jgi:CRP-like cAMP-binding protein
VDVKQLQGVGLFSSLSKGELEKLSRWTDDLTVREGEELATEGRFAHEFFMIEEGTAKVLKGGEEIAELGPGDFFGEIGVLEKELRTATVRATSPMRLIILSRWDLKRLERRDPSAFDQIRETLEARR